MRFYLKPRNSIWYICWTEPSGRPGRKSTGLRDREQARAALLRHEIKHSQPVDQQLSAITLDTILIRYWEGHGQSRFAPDVIRRVVKLAALHLPCCWLSDLTIARQEEFVKKLHVKPNTARRYMGVIRAALEWAAFRGEIVYAPKVLRVESEDGPGARPYTLDELKALLAACKRDHERRLLLLMVGTGPRPQAALHLTWDRVKDGVADYPVPGRRRTKKRRAKAPLAGTVARYLEGCRGLGPVVQWRGKGLAGHKMTFERVAKRAGVEGTIYGVRKALSTWLRQKNVPEWEVGALLGHRVASATTERYAHHRPDYMQATRAAVEELIGLICPGWLANYLPPSLETARAEAQIPKVVNGLDGRRDWDRTSDHFHVKEAVGEPYQPLEAANDDKWQQ